MEASRDDMADRMNRQAWGKSFTRQAMELEQAGLPLAVRADAPGTAFRNEDAAPGDFDYHDECRRKKAEEANKKARRKRAKRERAQGKAKRPRADSYRSRISKNRRSKVYERDGYACVKCGATDDLTLDHIVAVVKGGTNVIENLQTMCGPCNRAKGRG